MVHELKWWRAHFSFLNIYDYARKEKKLNYGIVTTSPRQKYIFLLLLMQSPFFLYFIFCSEVYCIVTFSERKLG